MCRSREVAEGPGHCVVRHNPQPNFIADQDHLGLPELHQRRTQFPDGGRHILIGDQQIGDPQGQAVDQDDVMVVSRLEDGMGQVDGLLDCGEAHSPARLVAGHPVAHFPIENVRCGKIGRARASVQRQAFGKCGLTRARAAQNQAMSCHNAFLFGRRLRPNACELPSPQTRAGGKPFPFRAPPAYPARKMWRHGRIFLGLLLSS